MGNDDLGEINIQNFQSIIDNYEKIVNDLSYELDSFKVEQSNLKLRINDLLDENKQLTKLQSSIENVGLTADSEVPIINNLKEQLDYVTKERESVLCLWKDSLQTIDHLETELKHYEGSAHGMVSRTEVTKLKTTYEQRIKCLEEQLAEARMNYDSTIKRKSQEIQLKKQELYKAIDTQCNTFEIVKNLEEEIKKLQERLKETQEYRNSLEDDIKCFNEKVEQFKAENIECRAKVTEAVQVVEAALNEKDAALLREQAAKDEIEKLSKTLSEIIEEAGEKVKSEVEAVKKECNEKIKAVLIELKESHNEVKAKNLEIQKLISTVDNQKKEIEKLGKFTTHHEDAITKFIALEKTLESTFQKLLLAEKKNIQLEAEQINMKADMDQMAGHYERDIKAREVEKVALQNKIKGLQSELDETHAKFIQMSEKMEMLNKDIMNTEKEFKEQIAMKEDLLKNSYSQADKKQCDLLTDIQKHVDSQMKMNQRWKSETRVIVQKFQTHIKESKVESNLVKVENVKLRDKLNKAILKNKDYRRMLTIISKDINKVAENVINDSTLVRLLPKKDTKT